MVSQYTQLMYCTWGATNLGCLNQEDEPPESKLIGWLPGCVYPSQIYIPAHLAFGLFASGRAVQRTDWRVGMSLPYFLDI